nr:amino acid ABC transporter ATP-binding protein [Pseudomonas sp.]
MIALKAIHKSFKGLEVLKGVDLDVPEGSVTALIGPSGSGKSTLLRCVNLLEMPQSGRVQIDDAVVTFGPGLRPERSAVLALRRKTGMVFQNFQLFPHLTALQNVIEGLVTVLKWSPEDARRRGRQLLDKVGMSAKADAWPSNLSGGQQQRVAIARA